MIVIGRTLLVFFSFFFLSRVDDPNYISNNSGLSHTQSYIHDEHILITLLHVCGSVNKNKQTRKAFAVKNFFFRFKIYLLIYVKSITEHHENRKLTNINLRDVGKKEKKKSKHLKRKQLIWFLPNNNFQTENFLKCQVKAIENLFCFWLNPDSRTLIHIYMNPV